MVAVRVCLNDDDSGPFSLDLPTGAVSIQQALDHLKRQLGAGWLRALPGHNRNWITKMQRNLWHVPFVAGGRAGWKAYTAEHMEVSLELGDGRAVSLPITAATRWRDVKAYAAALSGEPAARLRLCEPGGSKPVHEQDQAVPCSHLHISVCGPRAGYAHAVVLTLTGRKLVVNFSPCSTVLDVKLQIEDLEGIEIHQQRLIFSGVQLEDKRLLASYGVQDGMTLSLILRLRGGMSHEISGRDGGFALLDVAEDAGLVQVEVLLPDDSTVLLGCKPIASAEDVLAALRERLAERSVLNVEVDEVEDVETLRALLRQAQDALRQR